MRLSRPVTHVLFDLDGVLLDTEGLYTLATQEIVGRYGKVYDWSLKRRTMGGDARAGARFVIEQLGIPLSAEEFLALRQPILRRLFEEVTAMKGAERFVRELHARGVSMAVGTSSERTLATLKVRHHEWFGLFRAIVCGDDPGILAKKPAPDIFLLAARELGAAPRDCVVFEDSVAGVKAAREAGMQVVGVPDPAMVDEILPIADIVISGYDEIYPADLGFA